MRDPLAPSSMVACGLLALCLVLGGGGTSNPAAEFALEALFALGVLVAIWIPGAFSGQGLAPRPALILAGLVLLVPVLQLVTLPPSAWQALPGRQSEAAALALIGKSQQWMPLTQTPARTLSALLAMITEVAMFLVAARLGITGRMRLCLTIAAIGLVSVVLGCLQLSQAGGRTWSIYAEANLGWVLGFHANRNAATDTLQIALLAVAAYFGAARTQHRPNANRPNANWIVLALLLMLTLALGAVLTGSRTGMLLLPLTYAFAAWILWPEFAPKNRWLAWGLLLLLPVICAVAAQTAPVQQALSRFAQDGDHRWDIWHDTLRAIAQVWPAGSGIGSFQVAFDAAQSIERMQPLLDLRAHNDWLEWTLEAGLPGLIVLTAIAMIVLIYNLRALRRALRPGADPQFRAQVLFATATLLHIGLHAIFDYPLRSMALAALVGTAAAMLMPAARTAARVPQ